MDRAERANAYAEIVELLARYAQIIDRREFDALDEIFTATATFDAGSIGYAFLDGLDHIRRHMANDAIHPVAHLVVNVTAEITDEYASVTSRLIGLQPDGRVFVGEYDDAMAMTDAGWRIANRRYSRLSTPSDATFPPSVTAG